MRYHLGAISCGFLLLPPFFACQNVITTVAGTGTTYNFLTEFPLPAKATSVVLGSFLPSSVVNLVSPSGGVASDGAGNIYFAEVHGMILKLSPDGTLSAVCGNGTYGYSGSSGPNSSFQLFGPLRLALDPAGNVFIADQANNRVVKVTASGQASTFAGIGSPGFAGDGGPATSALVTRPQGVALDAVGDVFITEGGRLRKVTPDGVIHSIAVPTGALGLASGSDGTIYIAGGAYLYKLNPAGQLTTIAGSGQPPGNNVDGAPAINTSFSGLSVVAVAPDGTLYAIDTEFQLFVKITPDGNAHFPAISSGLRIITGMAVTPQGALYAYGQIQSGPLQGQVVQRIDPQGNATTVAGGGTLPSGDGGLATNAYLIPFTLAAGPDGSLFIAASNTLRRVTTDGIIHTAANGMLATAAAVDPSGNIYVAGPTSITEVTTAGTAVPIVASGITPTAIGLDGAGNIYYDDSTSGHVRKITSAGVQTDITTSGTAANMFVDAAGNIFLSDAINHVVRKITASGVASIVAGTVSPGGVSTGDGGPATSAHLTGPQAVAEAADGSLYIADGILVRRVDPSGIISTFAGTLNGTTPGDGGPPSQASFVSITDIKIDASGSIYIADQGDRRVRAILSASRAFTLSATSVSFSASTGNANIPSQQITIGGTQGLAWAATVTPMTGGSWLRIGPSSGTAPGSITLSADASFLCPGTYQSTVNIGGVNLTAQINVTGTPTSAAKIPANGIVGAAAYQSSGVSPGSLVSIFGTNLAPSIAQAGTLPLPITLSGVYVAFDGIIAPMLYVSPGQINVQAPWEIAGRGNVTVTQYINGSPSCPGTTIPMAAYAPSIFSVDGTGTGQGAILNSADATLAASSGGGAHPAHPGDTVLVFATGLGPVLFGPPTGWPGGNYSLVANFDNGNPVVTIAGGYGTKITFAGLAPGFVGLYQINVTLPPNAPTGPAIPMVLSINGVPSNTVTLAIQ